MAYNFLRAARDQPFLLPPDLRDWLPAGHLAWFILDVADQLDLQPFYLAHRDDGHGHPAYDPKLLLGVLLYRYCLGGRSSRQLERRCTEDIAFRVLAANQTPDRVTIARFRVRHEQALAGNAADKANRTLDRLEREVAEILKEAAEADQREDLGHGKACYAKRKETVEPVFGQIKEQQGARRFLRRGLAACEAEWKLLCGTHNLLKLWRHTAIQQAAGQPPPERPQASSRG